MSKAIIFIENYSAGGSDMVAKLIAEEVSFDKVYLFVNKRNDFSVLLSTPLKPHIKLLKYSLITTSELGVFAKRFQRHKFLYTLLRFLNLVIRYPLIVFSICYFYIKFKKIDANIFLSNNGGYPGGEYNRSATISAILNKKLDVFHLFHNIPTQSKVVFRVIENLYDKFLEKNSNFIGVADSIVADMYITRNFTRDIAVIPNGLKEKKIKTYKTDDTIIFLNVGVCDDRKNQNFLLDVAFELKKRGVENFSFTLMGAEGLDLGYKQQLIERKSQLNLNDCVKIVAFEKDPFPAYYSSDVFMLSSRVESLPIVLLEAMSVGLPLISTITGDINKQVIDGYNGFTIDQNDLNSYVDSVEFFINNKLEVGNYGKNSFKLFQRTFTIDNMVKKYENLFNIIH